jgi:hypothetical protein
MHALPRAWAWAVVERQTPSATRRPHTPWVPRPSTTHHMGRCAGGATGWGQQRWVLSAGACRTCVARRWVSALTREGFLLLVSLPSPSWPYSLEPCDVTVRRPPVSHAPQARAQPYPTPEMLGGEGVALTHAHTPPSASIATECSQPATTSTGSNRSGVAVACDNGMDSYAFSDTVRTSAAGGTCWAMPHTNRRRPSCIG